MQKSLKTSNPAYAIRLSLFRLTPSLTSFITQTKFSPAETRLGSYICNVFYVEMFENFNNSNPTKKNIYIYNKILRNYLFYSDKTCFVWVSDQIQISIPCAFGIKSLTILRSQVRILGRIFLSG